MTTGARRWWATFPVPANGTLSNVSHVVLPASTPVTDDARQERQLPMFEDTHLLLQALADIAAANRETAAMNRQTQKLLAHQIERLRSDHDDGLRPSERHRYPTNPRWRTWHGFVTELQRLQALLKTYERVTKTALARKGNDSARTITRAMEAYGLEPDDWPPSAWNPDEERVYQPKR